MHGNRALPDSTLFMCIFALHYEANGMHISDISSSMPVLNLRISPSPPKLGLSTKAWRGISLRRTIVSMAASSYKYVVLGGGNSAGYAAREV